jgi:hypothetical protein
MVQLQDSISKCLHHHTLSNMFFNKIFEAHCAQMLSCFGPRVSAWLITWLVFPTFQLSSPFFSTMLWMWLGLPHPSIVGIPQCVCTHLINLMVIHLYITSMATCKRKFLMQFMTPLLPSREMLTFTWNKNNYMHFLEPHSTFLVNKLTLCSPKMAFAP